jgi:hypothetical protein
MLLDDLLDVYVDWRESARAVAEAYTRWSFASGLEGALRFAAPHTRPRSTRSRRQPLHMPRR